MYSYEKRIKAVQLYIQYDLSAADTVRVLGYPDPTQLKVWYKEFIERGDLHQHFRKPTKYTPADIQTAVDYYLQHGRSISRTIRKLGYPSRPTMRAWLLAHDPDSCKSLSNQQAVVPFTVEDKRSAVIELCARKTSAVVVARRMGTTRSNLYNWKRKLLSKEQPMQKKRDQTIQISDDVVLLQQQVEQLHEQIYRQQLELDILTKAADLLKKERGIDLNQLTNQEKTTIVDALKTTHKLMVLLRFLKLSKSSYYYQKSRQSKPDKHEKIRLKTKQIFHENYTSYGYRRIHAILKQQGIIISEKIIRRIMREEQLIAIEMRKKQYSSYQGEISPAVENVVDRHFDAETPNAVWLTDLTEFHIPAGKVYLSPIIDCFDGYIVSWSISTSPNADLVNSMLDHAISQLGEQRPIVHSDRGCHYRWPGWIARMEAAQLTRSMSKKGCSPDNAACEGFFGRLKNECFYNRQLQDFSIDSFIHYLNGYLQWYNTKRIKKSLGYLSPWAYRQKLNLAA